MGLHYWNDTPDDPDRSRRRQAEFLVYESFPWNAVRFLAGKDADMKSRLNKFLSGKWPNRTKPVKVASDWYFS